MATGAEKDGARMQYFGTGSIGAWRYEQPGREGTIPLEENCPLDARGQERHNQSSGLVECRQDRAAQRHGQKPVAGVDGEEIGGPALKNVLHKERRRHKAKPANNAD
jgi:hypothetical protein